MSAFWKRWIAEVGLTNEAMMEALKGYDWMLACALSAYKRSDGMTMGFDMWWLISAENWTRDAQSAIPGLSADRLKKFLLWFAEANKHKSMKQVASESAAAVGKPTPVILGPGESIQVEATFPVRHVRQDLEG